MKKNKKRDSLIWYSFMYCDLVKITKIVNSGICLGGQDNWKAERECCSTLHIYFTFMKFHSIKITTISSRNNNIEVRRSHENRK